MKTLKTIAIIALLALATASPARAGTTQFSPPLASSYLFGLQSMCQITNVSDHDIKMRVQMMSRYGTVNNDSGVIMLQPHKSFNLPDDSILGGRWYCRFDFDARAEDVRAGICGVNTNQDTCTSTLPAY